MCIVYLWGLVLTSVYCVLHVANMAQSVLCNADVKCDLVRTLFCRWPVWPSVCFVYQVASVA